MYHPISNAAFNFGYHFSGILVGGLVLAAFVKPSSDARTEEEEDVAS